MEGLGRAHIDAKRRIPPAGPVKLGDAIAELFGAKLGEEPGEPAVYRPNRAQRRAAAKKKRRSGR